MRWGFPLAVALWAASASIGFAACDAVTSPPAFARPIAEAPVAVGFGMRLHPLLNDMRLHTGLDYMAPPGHAVQSAAQGRVVFSGRKGEYGNIVVIDHGDGLTSAYAHLRDILVAAGECVAQGHAVGTVGATGLAAEPHLHFEVRKDEAPLDPLPMLPP